ncbi:hypothetical protein K1T71_013914 [Dendrolimus kikuchii]|uniref:Uncharacterized protein n=1 Tax=Dendrolimus kikuchii TaxID=765133 RepID=A0ACC1CG38_9NEOP|nr:hypothetical protein K1T71_013914 [Dendrolimus kikuchii]
MVFATLYPKIYFRIASVLVLLSIQLSSSHEYSELISHLNKPSHDHQPLVLVLDSHGHLKSANSKSNMYQENRDEKELSLPLLLKQLTQIQNKKFSPKIRKPRHHQHEDYLDRRPRDREDRHSLDRDDDQREDRDHHGDHGKRDKRDRRDRDRKDHHSPVIKSLLRISNSLRCGAKNQCEDECSNNYNGKKKDECEDECEKNISCEEEEEKDESENDECGQSDEEDQCEGSTKGVKLITTTPKCKRC